MIDTFKNIFNVPDLRKRVLFTFALLAVYRVGAWIPSPGIDPEALDAFFAKSQEFVTGSVTLSLYKGNLTVKSRKSPHSLYQAEIASFDTGNYNHLDAEGFISLLGLPAAVRSKLYREKYETLARTV